MGIRLVVRSGWSDSGAECVYEFDQSRVVIGRGASADVRLPHSAVSTLHATVRTSGLGYALVDEGSTNGSRVNGTPIAPHRPKPLRDGDHIELGGFSVRFESGMPVAGATSADRTAALARQLVRGMFEDAEQTEPRLQILNGPGQNRILQLPAPPARWVVGRGDDCDWVLDDADASREHVELTRDLDGVLVQDLGSKNGLIVNERQVSSRRLQDRDELCIGSTVLVFEEPADARLRDIEAQADEAWTELPQPAPQAHSEDTGEHAAEPGDAERGPSPPDEPPSDAQAEDHAEPAPPQRAGRRDSEHTTDLLIYLLAAVVLAASLAGLFLLLQTQ
jgi:pSer/pThr/pTyr-binding forkhead associated (FHA) protein